MTSGDLFRITFGRLLAIKVAIVGVALLFSIVHDFVLGPRMTTLMERQRLQGVDASGEMARLRTAVSWLARLNLLLALAIVALGVMLVRGLP